MARVTFQATKAAVEHTDGALICGVSDEGSTYLMLQRAPDGVANDEGVYLEHNDQINGGYGCIRRCALNRTALSLDLGRQLGNLEGVEGFDVHLSLAPSEYLNLRRGLEQIFRGHTDVLTVA